MNKTIVVSHTTLLKLKEKKLEKEKEDGKVMSLNNLILSLLEDGD